MAISARNQLRGTIEEIRLGSVMAHVVVRVGENLAESVITRGSAEETALKKGDVVKAISKSTEEHHCARECHHNSFTASCTCRAVVDVLVIAPAVPETPEGVKTIRLGVLKFARLSRLKISARN